MIHPGKLTILNLNKQLKIKEDKITNKFRLKYLLLGKIGKITKTRDNTYPMNRKVEMTHHKNFLWYFLCVLQVSVKGT